MRFAKSFIRVTPAKRIVRYVMGSQGNYDYTIFLCVGKDIQLRDNCLESARQTCNRLLEKTLVKNYFFRVRVYCHHILRENPLASGAGADRMSTGMQQSFGKPIGVAARCFQ